MEAERTYALTDVARLPAAGDNAAIAVIRLDAGTPIRDGGLKYTLPTTVLEGHRFAARPIARGEAVLSWGLPFGVALRAIAPGAYLANARMLDALRERRVDFAVPPLPNFADRALEPYRLDEAAFVPGVQVARSERPATFEGYRRSGGRGVGTRNDVVILGTTSRTAGYARALAERLAPLANEYVSVDGIVPVAHTEGGGASVPNNLQLLLRTLAGFVVHPNVGAVLIADDPDAPVTNNTLRRYMGEHGYPLADVRHRFLSVEGGFEESLRAGEDAVRAWLPEVGDDGRTAEPVSGLKVALQCGGSDAFSGVSGNPLAAWAAKEIIRHGGSANLAETDELIGAEPYVLANVRDLATARAFLGRIAAFEELVGRHGHTAEDNPSGGNNYRGLYNISVKSIGAAMKRDPEVRLDAVLDYGARMDDPGYYFMDSPGNDLESIAGQVASGANLIYFVTGNGSITNFPFVPTIKIVTTSRRFALLEDDMDVNAGRNLDGEPLDALGRELFERTLRVASGERSAGERAGHAQVSIWRTWARGAASTAPVPRASTESSGEPLAIMPGTPAPSPSYRAVATPTGPATDQIGLVLPTSLCSGQVARMVADTLNREGLGAGRVSRFVALPHTEGCGVSAGSAVEIYTRTLLGYLTHPTVRAGLLLEHGCEKTHNDYVRGQLAASGLDPDRFGWASVQLDGGIRSASARVVDWFADALDSAPALERERVSIGSLRLGLAAMGPVSDTVAHSLAAVTRSIVGAGGTVVVPRNAPLLSSAAYADELLKGAVPDATLAYGQTAAIPGLHVMETPTDHWVETLTGLGATGAELVLVYVPDRAVQTHRMIPVLQVSDRPEPVPDTDLTLTPGASAWPDEILGLIIRAASGEYVPRLFTQGNSDFQFTRGLLGVSM